MSDQYNLTNYIALKKCSSSSSSISAYWRWW